MNSLTATLLSAARDVLPIALVLFIFQYLVLRRPFAHAKKVTAGVVFMLIGLTLLLLGLEKAVFPLGKNLAWQLLERAATPFDDLEMASWGIFLWMGSFTASVTFAAVFAEPILTALTTRAQQVSGNTIDALRMRLVVALGAALGTTLGIIQILWGGHIGLYAGPLVLIICLLSCYAPPLIRPLAYDAGVAGISTIMVPMLIAIGAALVVAIPGRNLMIYGFGIVVLGAMMPVASVLMYAIFASKAAQRHDNH